MDGFMNQAREALGNNNNNNNNNNTTTGGAVNPNTQTGATGAPGAPATTGGPATTGATGNTGNTAAAGSEDYGDKGLDFLEQKSGRSLGRDTNEKITDGARGLYEKVSGSKLDPKYSN